MSSSPNVVTSADGTRIASDRAGDGPPVVLVGGAFQHRAVDPRTAQLAQHAAVRAVADVVRSARAEVVPGQTHDVRPRSWPPSCSTSSGADR